MVFFVKELLERSFNGNRYLPVTRGQVESANGLKAIFAGIVLTKL